MLRRNFSLKRISKVKKYIIIIFLCMISFTLALTFGRYVYTKVLDLYFLTKNFYFESDKLKYPEASYSSNYWNGVDPYDIVINLKTLKNDKLKTNSNVTYTITKQCPNTVSCTLSKAGDTISKDTNLDTVNFTMTPIASFNDNDTVTMRIIATSTSPYTKTLSATFTLTVGKYGLSHVIEDEAGRPYLNLKVTNTLDSYVVKEAFGNNTPGNHISQAVYDSLSDTDKAKCASAVIGVSFNPNVIKIDNTNKYFMDAYNVQTQVINSFDYVNSFTFDMNPSISNTIKFYKNDKSMNYSNSNVLTVTYYY